MSPEFIITRDYIQVLSFARIGMAVFFAVGALCLCIAIMLSLRDRGKVVHHRQTLCGFNRKGIATITSLKKAWARIRTPAVTLSLPEKDKTDQIVHVPWWVFLIIPLFPLFISRIDPENPFTVFVLGLLAFCGLVLVFLAVLSVGCEGRILSDLVKLPLTFTLVVSSGALLCLTAGRIDEKESQRISAESARNHEYARRINSELASFPWSSVVEARFQKRSRIAKVILVDTRTHRLSAWHRRLVPFSFEAHSLDEQWKDSEERNWITSHGGRATEKRPVKYRVWQVSLLDPKTREVFAQETFSGTIEVSNFVNWPSRYRTDEEIAQWEKEHCLAPTDEVMRWMRVPKRRIE